MSISDVGRRGNGTTTASVTQYEEWGEKASSSWCQHGPASIPPCDFPRVEKRVMCLGRGGKDNRLAYQLQLPVSLAHEGHFTLPGLSRCMTGNSDRATAAPLWGSGFQFEGSRQEKNLQFNISREHRKTEKLFNDGQKKNNLCWTLMMEQMDFCFFSWSLTCELITFVTD